MRDAAGREHHQGCEFEGIYRKYEVRRIEDPSGIHTDCRYIVLDVTHDPAAREAALELARQVRHERPNFSADLFRLVGSIRAAAITTDPGAGTPALSPSPPPTNEGNTP